MSRIPDAFSVTTDSKPSSPVHRFSHVAMASVFEILIAGEDAEYARQAADAAFAELDNLHHELNRYSSTSDISQINALHAGQGVRVGIATMDCIKAAAKVNAETGGAFDVTIGSLLACWRDPDKKPRTPTEEELAAARARTGMYLLDIRESEHLVGVKADGVSIDLGGVGKGYAVDQMVALLKEWSIKAALVNGGTSSVLAFGAPPGRDGWRVSLRDPEDESQTLGSVLLKERSLSGSAMPPGNPHIIDPRTGRPAAANVGSWAAATSATITDCLSTAFFIMSPAEVEAYVRNHPDTSAMLITKDSSGRKVLRFGKWES
jgi:thiamine biosynthesis lipoprotein